MAVQLHWHALQGAEWRGSGSSSREAGCGGGQGKRQGLAWCQASTSLLAEALVPT